jgi:hypothetical protein
MAHPEPYREQGEWLDALSIDDKIGWVARGYAEDAIDSAREEHGIELDCSEESLKHLETILERIYRKIPRGTLAKLTRKTLSDEDLYEMSKPWGCYLGEVIRLNAGAAWVAFYENAEGWDFNMRHGETWLWPVAKVQKRLTNGPEDEPVGYYRVLKGILNEKETAGT